MIPPRNPRYRAALAGAHNAYSRVEVWRSGIAVEELSMPAAGSAAALTRGAPVFFGGSVRATLGSRVTRSLTLSVPEWLYPWDSGGLLSPYGSELRVFRGVLYGSGETDEFPVFRGPVTAAKPSGAGLVTITAGDRAQDVVSAGFTGPEPSGAGELITAEFKRLVLAAVPDATFGTFDDIPTLVPNLSYDADRGAALDGLSKMAGAYWYALAGGDFVMRYIPWTVPITSSKIVLANGPGGTLLSAFPNRDRANVYNRVTVSNESATGAPPVFATVDDDDPTSPTYIDGPYGIKSLQLRVTQATSQSNCRTAAAAQLQRSKALAQSWTLTCVPDGSIELGDPLDVQYVDISNTLRQATQLAAGFTMPLDNNAAMQVDGRDPIAQDLPS